MGPYQRTPKEVATRYVLRFFRVRSVGPVGDFLDIYHGNLRVNPPMAPKGALLKGL